MRLRIPVLLVLVLAASAVTADELKFVRVWPGWHDAEYFERVSEYFTHTENTGGQFILRTQPEQRAGFYFLTRLANPGAALDHTKLVLDVIMPGSPAPKTYTFEPPLPTGETVYQIGVTGADWPGRKIHPLAWRLTVTGADGTTLAVENSFLWEIPAKHG